MRVAFNKVGRQMGWWQIRHGRCFIVFRRENAQGDGYHVADFEHHPGLGLVQLV